MQEEPTESDFVVLVGGRPMLRGTSVAVQEVLDLWRSGIGMLEIPSHYPNLSVAAVFAALRYARDHGPVAEQPASEGDA